MKSNGIGMGLTPSETQLAARIGFDEHVLRLVKNALGKEVMPYYDTMDYVVPENRSETVIRDDDEVVLIRAITVPLDYCSDDKWHLDAIYRVRSILPPEYRAFLVNHMFYGLTVSVLKSVDPYEIIRVCETHGWDYEDRYYGSEDLTQVLVEWQRECRLDVFGAGFNNINLILETLPDDLVAFAEKVNFLCWELDQINNFGQYGDDAAENRIIAEKLAAHLRETRRLYLWWD